MKRQFYSGRTSILKFGAELESIQLRLRCIAMHLYENLISYGRKTIGDFISLTPHESLTHSAMK